MPTDNLLFRGNINYYSQLYFQQRLSNILVNERNGAVTSQFVVGSKLIDYCLFIKQITIIWCVHNVAGCLTCLTKATNVFY